MTRIKRDGRRCICHPEHSRGGGGHTVFRALREMYRQARHEQMHINQSVLIGIICIICA